MNEAKHTPGPWQVYVSEPPFGRTIHIGQADDATYTPHASDVAYQAVGCDPTYVQMANARLIAAAPELLEALLAVLPRALLMINENHAATKLARAAIAKATGEQA